MVIWIITIVIVGLVLLLIWRSMPDNAVHCALDLVRQAEELRDREEIRRQERLIELEQQRLKELEPYEREIEQWWAAFVKGYLGRNH